MEKGKREGKKRKIEKKKKEKKKKKKMEKNGTAEEEKRNEIIETHLRNGFQTNQQSNQITDSMIRPKEALLLHHNQFGK
jgi:hypothetical protein